MSTGTFCYVLTQRSQVLHLECTATQAEPGAVNPTSRSSQTPHPQRRESCEMPHSEQGPGRHRSQMGPDSRGGAGGSRRGSLGVGVDATARTLLLDLKGLLGPGPPRAWEARVCM